MSKKKDTVFTYREYNILNDIKLTIMMKTTVQMPTITGMEIIGAEPTKATETTRVSKDEKNVETEDTETNRVPDDETSQVEKRL